MSGFLLWFAAGLWATPARAVESAYAASVEHEVKAAFVHNFARFVEWPEHLFAGPEAPLHLGYLGNGPINEALLELNGKPVHNRTLKVSRIENINQVEDYHLIFINPSQSKRSESILAALRGRGILTVSDIEGFTRQCGMINFYLDRGRVRFEINPSAAERENLKVSSKLLKLARIEDSICR